MEIPSADNDAWNTAEGKMNGRPSLIRFRPNLKGHLGNPKYPKRLTIFWDYGDDELTGMPTSEQIDEMKVFEDALVNALDPGLFGIFAFAYTSAGTREWHFYVNKVSEIQYRINQALAEFPKLPIELQIEDDADWGELKQVYLLCN